MTTLFLVFRDPGPSWVPGVPTRQQPLWDEHAVFMDRVFETGRIVLAGPYADFERVRSSSSRPATPRRRPPCSAATPGRKPGSWSRARSSSGPSFSTRGVPPDDDRSIRLLP